MLGQLDFDKPILLQSDNFTPRTRTPWGGTNIANRYKAALGCVEPNQVVGESWEFSVDEQFPSYVGEGP